MNQNVGRVEIEVGWGWGEKWNEGERMEWILFVHSLLNLF